MEHNRKSNRIFLIARLTLTLFFTASLIASEILPRSDGENEQVPVQNYMPLSTRNFWTYRLYINENTEEYTDSLEKQIADAECPDGSEISAAYMLYVQAFGTRAFRGAYQFCSTGLYLRTSSSSELVLDSKFAVNRKWQAKKGSMYKYVGFEPIVKTPAGEFKNCIVIEQHHIGQENLDTLEYYAPHVGQIKTVQKSTGKLVTELISYKALTK